MDLMHYLPYRAYHQEEHVQDIEAAIAVELDQLCAVRDDLFAQLRPAGATWGMAEYEREYGLIPEPSKPAEQRLARWRAKRRGMGTVTAAFMKNVVESWGNGEVEIIEVPEAYTFYVKFIGKKGIPANLRDVKNAIGEIRPAHLAFDFIFTYLTWNEFDAYHKNWNTWDDLNLKWDEFEEYREMI